MRPKDIIVVGTRNSQLALTQTSQTITALKSLCPGPEFVVKTISTAGDRVPNNEALADHQGIFVKELQDALLQGSIDIAVHSLKDMPCEIMAGLELGAVSARVTPQDAFLARDNVRFAGLKPNARIGTSSIRRRAQVLLARPDLQVVGLRGNVDTRVRKLQAGEVDAIIIAAAGLTRIGLDNLITELMPFDIMLPAPCQGALGIEIRQGDQQLKEIIAKFDHQPTRLAIMAERAFLSGLGGGCSLPVGAYAEVSGRVLTLRVQVVSPNGDKSLRRTVSGDVNNADDLGQELARELLTSEGEWLQQALGIKA
ncbi:MAG: hydroxymethylbilane synthase [Candidatus Omnitrophica bacterium]|nr:hydroxymethylbilane synthase [Candidatus Omnitrophota bacterium]